MLDERIASVARAEITSALEAFKPEVAEAVKGAIQEVMVNVQKAGVTIPGITPNPAGGGVVPGSQVTPAGAQLLNWITNQGQQQNLIPMEVQQNLMSALLTRLTEPQGGDQFATYRAGQMDMLKFFQTATRKGMPGLQDLETTVEGVK